MNPLTNVKNINKLNDIEAELGVAGSKSSWHEQYKDSAYIFIGGLPFDLTEGDIVCVFSQYGEIVNINLVRDKKTGKSRGYCFLAYEDQRSTTLAVDNFNGIKILGRVIRVDHVSNYRKPKEDENDDEITKMLREEGCAPKIASPPPSEDEDDNYQTPIKKAKIGHKTKSQVKKKKKKKHKKDGRPTAKLQADSSDSSSSQSERDTTLPRQIRVKQEVDRGYGTPRELNVKEPSDRDEKYHPDEMRHRAEDTGRHRRTDGGKTVTDKRIEADLETLALREGRERGTEGTE